MFDKGFGKVNYQHILRGSISNKHLSLSRLEFIISYHYNVFNLKFKKYQKSSKNTDSFVALVGTMLLSMFYFDKTIGVS